MKFVVLILAALWFGSYGISIDKSFAGEAPPDTEEENGNALPAGGMDVAHLDRVIAILDPDVDVLTEGAVWQFTIDGVQVTVIADGAHDRMRAIVAVARTEELDANVFQRLLQANFDTALDARYAIARDVLWSAFIHPLSRLNESQLLSGLAQTVTLARTFGSSYSSGGLSFGGGDSGEILEEELRQRLIEEGFAL